MPPLHLQQKIINEMDKALLEQANKEQEAERLLESIDSVVLEALGIDLPAEEEVGLEERTFFRSFRTLDPERIDPFPYQRRRMQAIQSIEDVEHTRKRLHEVFLFRREVVAEADGLPYIGLENIQADTGEYIDSSIEKETFNSAFRFYKGDILFPKLRPYLNKVHLASSHGVCSTEFHVLTQAKGLEEYLAICLRSRLVVNQTTCLMTGNTLPRLQTSDVENLFLPLPDKDIQRTIAEEVKGIQKRAKQIQEEASRSVVQAKQKVEQMILGEEG